MSAVVPLHSFASLSVFISCLSLTLGAAEESLITVRRAPDQGLTVWLFRVPATKTELDLQLSRRLMKTIRDNKHVGHQNYSWLGWNEK